MWTTGNIASLCHQRCRACTGMLNVPVARSNLSPLHDQATPVLEMLNPMLQPAGTTEPVCKQAWMAGTLEALWPKNRTHSGHSTHHLMLKAVLPCPGLQAPPRLALQACCTLNK